VTSTVGGGWSAPRSGRFTPGKDPVPIVQEAGWAPELVWTCPKNLAPTGIPSPDRPARSQSLYRLSYAAHYTSLFNFIIIRVVLILNGNITTCSVLICKSHENHDKLFLSGTARALLTWYNLREVQLRI
jgi:hypothetical protein